MSEERTVRPSDEVDERQLELARNEGDAFQEAVEYMIEEVANTGDTTPEGEYVVGFAQEEAEGMYRMANGELEWVPPDEENCHLEVVVADAADGRFVPGLTIRATLDAPGGEQVGPKEVPFVWHPGLLHYGRNFVVPGDGQYDITVEVDPATFPRHDEKNGERYADGVEVTFEDVSIETGQD